MKHDVLIIGSGLAGLTCGYILAKNGMRVAVLEKNPRIGGCLQAFRRDGVWFDTGMHYIGSMDPGQTMYKFWNYLDVLKNISLRKLDENSYDVIQFGDKRFYYAMGYDNFVETLSGQFPNQRKAIAQYVDKIREISNESPLYNLREIKGHVLLETDYVKTSVNEYIEGITSDPMLQNVLTGNLPLYAGVKDKTPLYVPSLLNSSYIQSAYRVVGGGDSVAESLVRSIESMGGMVRTRAEVVQINCDSTRAVSVELSNGEVIESKSFISSAHPCHTLSLLETPLIRKAYRDRVSNLENTISNFTVYIRFKEQRVAYMNSNFYQYSGKSVWECGEYDQTNWPKNYLYMHQAPADGGNYAQGALIIAYMHYKEVERWADTKVGQRGTDYEEFKAAKTEVLLERLERDFPGIRANIQSVEASSPLTYRDYTHTKEGSLYGVIRDKNFPLQTLVSQRTKIPNLFLTGQNINAHGLLGVTISAIITCAEYLGINHIIREINNKS